MKFIQNLKSGFVNMKELFKVMLSDDSTKEIDSYDLYINGKDQTIAKTAEALKAIEEMQEANRMSFFGMKLKKKTSHRKE